MVSRENRGRARKQRGLAGPGGLHETNARGPRPFLVALIPTWQDGPAALGTAVRTALTAADAVIVLDGGIEGIVAANDATTPDLFGASSGSWINDPRVHTFAVDRLWKSQAQKRNALLGYAHDAGATWALFLDADEQLHGGQILRRQLETWTEPVFPLPFEPIPGEGFNPAAFKCFRVARFLFVAAASIVVDIEDPAHTIYALTGAANPAGWDRFVGASAFVTHHPERRPPERRHIRLGEVEHVLEPAPDASLFPIRLEPEP